jgi:hypothetical protein
VFSRIANLIANSIKIFSLFDEQSQNDGEESSAGQQDGLSVSEKMELWNTEKPDEIQQDVTTLGDFDIPDGEDDEDYVITHFTEAWVFLTNSHAYQWLLGRVRTELLLTRRDGTSAEAIRREILKGLASLRKRHGYGQTPSKAKFEMSWSLPGFLKEQYPEKRNPQLGSLITIVGSGDDVQALTCSRYMSQVWPVTGLETLSALQGALDKGPGNLYKGKPSPHLDYCDNSLQVSYSHNDRKNTH